MYVLLLEDCAFTGDRFTRDQKRNYRVYVRVCTYVRKKVYRGVLDIDAIWVGSESGDYIAFRIREDVLGIMTKEGEDGAQIKEDNWLVVSLTCDLARSSKCRHTCFASRSGQLSQGYNWRIWPTPRNRTEHNTRINTLV